MEKKQEIEILQSLKGCSRFGESFSDKEIDMMCDCIEHDAPIDKKKLTEETVAQLRTELSQRSREGRMKLLALVDAIIDSNEGCLDEKVWEVLRGEVGLKYIVNHKHGKGYALNKKEIDALVGLLNNRETPGQRVTSNQEYCDYGKGEQIHRG